MPQSAGAPSTPAAQAAAARLASMTPPSKVAAPIAAPQASVPTKETRKAKRAEDGADGKKKKKKPVKLIAGVVFLLVVGYVVKGKVVKPHYGPGAKVPLGGVVALQSVTTNLSDGHLAQVSVSIQLTKAASTKQVAKDEPEMVATIVSDLGKQTYAGLLAPAGRVALRSELLRAFQAELGTSEGAQQVVGVYITGFVLQ